MTTQPAQIDVGPATLFNSHMFDLGNRVNTVCNYLLVVNGGVLSITIGAFIGSSTPKLTEAALNAIRFGWYALTISMILALAGTFFVLAAQAIVQRKMRKAFGDGSPPGLRLFTGPPWIGRAIWTTVPCAFLACVVGVACVSYGAVQLLRIQ